MDSIKIKVYGKVQGVFFRKYTRLQADKLGIKGYVRNEDDGTVFIIACGEKEPLSKFREWCSHGPEYARVDKLDVEEIPVQSFIAFSIL
jgi:acylphosphatase